MDTQNTSDPVSWLSLAKKHFKPKTTEVMGVATPQLKEDGKLPSYTYSYVHVHACKASCTKHVIKVIQYIFTRWTVGDFRCRLQKFFIVFRRKTENTM